MAKPTELNLMVQGNSADALAYAVVNQVPKAKRYPKRSTKIAKLGHEACLKYSKRGEMRCGGMTLNEYVEAEIRVGMGFIEAILFQALIRILAKLIADWFMGTALYAKREN